MRPRARGEGGQQRAAALARLDAADRRAPSGGRPSPVAAPPRRGRAGSRRSGAPSTPLGITSASTPWSRRSTSAQWRLTQMRWSTSSIEARWHSASTGLAKSSTWWTVRTIDGHPALGAQRQQRARRQAVLGVVHVGRAGGAHALGERRRVAQDARLDVLARRAGPPAPGAPATRGSRKKRAPSADSAHSSTSWPRSPSASARQRAWTTPPARLGGVGDEPDPHPREGGGEPGGGGVGGREPHARPR